LWGQVEAWKARQALTARSHRTTALTASLALALALAGCGGGGEGSSTTATSSEAGATAAPPGPQTPAGDSAPAEATTAPKVRLGSPSEVPPSDADGSIQEFGREASEQERAAAARTLAAYLRAYADGDGATACALLGAGMVELLERGFTQAAAEQGTSQGRQAAASCSQALEGLTAGMPVKARRSLTGVIVLSLRFDGERAFTLYRDSKRMFFSIPMVREAGAWKVAGLAGSPLL
jgi:hypothetical protein